MVLLNYYTVREYARTMHFSVSTASTSVTSFEPRRNRIVPATLSENVTFVCTVDSSVPIWKVAHSQFFNSSRQLTGIQLQSGISVYEQRGILTENNISQHLSRLIITKAARQRYPVLQVQCNDLNTTHCNPSSCSSDFYYVVTNGKCHYYCEPLMSAITS